MGIYDYGYNYGQYDYVESILGGVAGFFLVFLFLFYLLMIAYAITTYVLQSLGMYTVAKRRGIHHSWLAWIPIGSAWLLGGISDQYQYVAKGSVRNRRKVLLGLEIALFAVLGVMYAAFFALAFSDNGATIGSMFALVLLLYFAMLVLAVIDAVFRYIALYDLYASCEPANATLYLVLSILLNVTQPFFVFFSRKKDLGMPPRKTPPQIRMEPIEYREEPEQDVPVSEEPAQEEIAPDEPIQEAPVDSFTEDNT